MASASPCVRELGEMYELVEEVLIRIPPDEPAGLIRASLVCKAWCGLVSGHAFRSHYRVFHKTPPILGFLQSWEDEHERFVPTTRFRPRNCKLQDRFVLDCRHCRVLLMCYYDEDADEDEDEDDEEEDDDDGEEEDDYEEYEEMVVWDPLSGRRMKLRNPGIFNPRINLVWTDYSATVLCAADGCNHDACNLAPFLVAFVVLDDKDQVVWASVYSSETQEWTSPASIHVGSVGTLEAGMVGRPGVLVGQALHFLIDRYEGDSCIIKYDLGSHRLSVIDLPGLCVFMRNPLLILSEDGRLGVIDLDEHGLCHMWSVQVTVDGVASWIKLREIDFGMLLTLGNPKSSDSLWLVGCVEGTDILVVATDIGAFTIDLKSLRSRKLSSKPYEDICVTDRFESLFLYTSFNNPPAVPGVMEVAEESQISK